MRRLFRPAPLLKRLPTQSDGQPFYLAQSTRLNAPRISDPFWWLKESAGNGEEEPLKDAQELRERTKTYHARTRCTFARHVEDHGRYLFEAAAESSDAERHASVVNRRGASRVGSDVGDLGCLVWHGG